MRISLRPLFALSFFIVASLTSRAGDHTWVYAVEVHATVQASPAQVLLQWPTDEVPATGYTIWRKAPDEVAWNRPVNLPADSTQYLDADVAVGGVYEYQIEKRSGYVPAWGYLMVGINAPAIEARGKVILVVERGMAAAVPNELRRLERDLVGDGWGVTRLEVGRDERPADIRARIQAEWNGDRANVRAAFLLGHVPVARSGQINVDGHGGRPLPSDGYYGDMDGDWPDADGDGVFDLDGFPSDLELEVGRVDFANLRGENAATPYPGEADLMRRYLDKDHAFRFAQTRPAPRALMGNVYGDAHGQAVSAGGYRAFAALVGPENIVESGTELSTPSGERWINKIAAADYLWAMAASAGSNTSLGTLGTHGAYNDLWSSDFVDLRAKGTFYMFFGSWSVDWDQTDNLLRTALAAPDYGLGAVWSGRPHFYFHSMGVGETIGRGVRLSQNNNGLVYRNYVQRHPRGIHMALLGDPTLRLTAVAPPSNVRATTSGGQVSITWSPSPDAVFGYRIYRSAYSGAPFQRISGELESGTTFTDRPSDPGSATYMVRAVALQLGPSGSYYNPSQGAFSRDDFGIPNQAPAALPAGPWIGRVMGAGTEVGADIRHLNGNIFDQVLLQGVYAAAKVDPGQILRMSFVDPNDDIVQVEISGAGTIAVFLDDASGPGTPAKYNQGVAYMKGRATIAVSGANQTTELSIFSVGRANAVDQGLFRNESYDGIADIALLTVSSLDGKFGGLRMANVRFSASEGMTGIYASDIAFNTPVLVGDIEAQGSAQPTLHLGAAGTDSDKSNDVRITGGDLYQPNQADISVSGISRLSFENGTTSHDVFLPAQSIRGRLEQNGDEITSVIVSPAR